MKRLKIAYITASDPKNKHSWSGTVHYILKTVEKNIGDVDKFGPAEPVFIIFLCKVFNYFSVRLLNKRYDYRNATPVAKAYARLFSKKLQKQKYDLIISPAGVSYVAYLKTDIPIVLVLDKCTGGSIDYHTILSNLWSFSKRQSIETDIKAIQKSTLTLFSSDWAANHALKEYKIAPSKIKVLSFGANMDEIPEKEYVFQHKENNTCKLLLVGTYWENKGADIALNALNELLKLGIDAYLTVCGCTPPEEIKHERLTIIPFLNKNTTEGRKELEKLFLSHTFFILPTRFDCTPIVFCEAAAYGLPVLAANTGGISTLIKEGVNGFLINYSDKGKAYADKINELCYDKIKMQELSISSRKYYEEQLNWDTWAKQLLETDLLKRLNQ